jgi:hypothetical protein
MCILIFQIGSGKEKRNNKFNKHIKEGMGMTNISIITTNKKKTNVCNT